MYCAAVVCGALAGYEICLYVDSEPGAATCWVTIAEDPEAIRETMVLSSRWVSTLGSRLTVLGGDTSDSEDRVCRSVEIVCFDPGEYTV